MGIEIVSEQPLEPDEPVETVLPDEPPVTRGLDDDRAEALLLRFRAGDTGALDSLLEAYTPALFSIFLRWFRLSAEDAEDLYQEVLLQFVVKAQEIRNPRGWLIGTAINQARKRIRRLVRDRNLASRFGDELDLRETRDTEDLRDLVERGLSQLRGFDRRLLTLLYFEGLSYEETAARLDRPMGSIGPLRGRALKRLSTALAELDPTSPPLAN